MNERFERMRRRIAERHQVDVVADILLGRPDRVFLIADTRPPAEQVLEVVSGTLATIGYPDADGIAMRTLVDDLDFANAYAEVAGDDAYRAYVLGVLGKREGEPNVTFPIRRGNRRIWVNVVMNPVRGHPDLLSVFLTDMTATMDEEERNYFKSHHDPLTGLFNKYTLDFHYGERYRLPGFHVLYLDLDDFKSVNDRCGHLAGDHFLVAFADILRNHENGITRFYRLGGDEFVGLVFGPEAAVRVVALDILERTRTIPLPDLRKASVSIGIVRATERDDVIVKADRVMYRVKNTGKDGYRYEIEA